MAVTLVRHTTPEISPDICYGSTDCDVASSFVQEAEEVLRRLPPVKRIVTSPLLRCRRLANRIGEEMGLTPETDPRLVEMDFGTWEGLPWAKIPRAELDQWADDFLHARPHGGESVAQLHARASSAVADLWTGDTPALAVTHAGVIRSALARTMDPEAFERRIEFGGVVVLDEDTRRQHKSI